MFKIDPTTKVTHIYGFLILVGFGVGACMVSLSDCMIVSYTGLIQYLSNLVTQ
jgi:hypothetical protein